jgi:hypothetical protein
VSQRIGHPAHDRRFSATKDSADAAHSIARLRLDLQASFALCHDCSVCEARETMRRPFYQGVEDQANRQDEEQLPEPSDDDWETHPDTEALEQCKSVQMNKVDGVTEKPPELKQPKWRLVDPGDDFPPQPESNQNCKDIEGPWVRQ